MYTRQASRTLGKENQEYQSSSAWSRVLGQSSIPEILLQKEGRREEEKEKEIERQHRKEKQEVKRIAKGSPTHKGQSRDAHLGQLTPGSFLLKDSALLLL